jgi:LDH2 family malate/lactate/ureidoglycolate dehydrogenase
MAVDGRNGMGAVVGARAMDEVLARADEFGIAAATVRNSNHFGAAGWYAARAPARGCVGICISAASKSLAPYGSRKPFFGTNPIAVAIPAGDRAPWVMDMATSLAARGHIRIAAAAGRSIPEGWALDRDGRPTTDAAAALAGVMLPFAGPKGSALAFLADILAGALAGAGFGGSVRDMNTDFTAPQNVGHFVMAFRIDAFTDPAEFAERMAALIARLKSLAPAEGFAEVNYPGEIEARLAAERRVAGIPLSDECLAALRKLAADLGIPFDTR